MLNILAAPLHVVGFLAHVCTHAFMVIAEFFNLDVILAWTIRLTAPGLVPACGFRRLHMYLVRNSNPQAACLGRSSRVGTPAGNLDRRRESRDRQLRESQKIIDWP